MEYMAHVQTTGGHYYMGDGSTVKDIIAMCTEDIETGEGEYEVQRVYIQPYNPETGELDSDADPVWMWSRDVDPDKRTLTVMVH